MVKYNENDLNTQIKRLRINLFSLFDKIPNDLIIVLERNEVYKNSRLIFYEDFRKHENREVLFDVIIKFHSFNFLYNAINSMNQMLEHCGYIEKSFAILEAHVELKAKEAQFKKDNIGGPDH